MRLPDYGFARAGSVNTEGDALLKAANVRSTFGVDGTGVRVGVISGGVEGLAASQASGDLPTVNTATCDVAPGSPTDQGAGGEGTAMLEIVHDLAPGAELWFGYFGSTSLFFNDAVNCLAGHVDVIVDDIGFYNLGPYDGTSYISANTAQAVGDPANRVRGYYTAVGNDGLAHYQASYTDSGYHVTIASNSWELNHFQAALGTSDAGSGIACQCADAALLSPGATVTVFLSWNDIWGASQNDYDLLVSLDGGLSFPFVYGGTQSGAGDPAEEFSYQNPGPSDQWVNFAIGNYNESAVARTLDMFVECGGGCYSLPNGLSSQPMHNFNTRCNAISNQADARGPVIAVAAIDAADPGTDNVEPFSSCGPTSDGRLKPDVSAVDGVSVTGSGGFSSPFFGTSAAAPHAAGIAALLLDCNPALTRDGLRNALLNTSVDVFFTGPDIATGYGRLDALAAANSVGCAAGSTPTPTATHTPTATRTPTSTGTLTDTATPGSSDTPVPPTDTNTPTLTSTPGVPTSTRSRRRLSTRRPIRRRLPTRPPSRARRRAHRHRMARTAMRTATVTRTHSMR